MEKIPTPLGRVDSASWNPLNGRYLGVGGGPETRSFSVIDLNSTQSIGSWDGFSECRHVAWSPDGERVALCLKTNVIPVLDFKSLETDVKISRAPALFAEWSPNGERLAVGIDECVLTIWRMDAPEKSESSFLVFEKINDLDWSPDGSLVLACSSRGAVTVWEAIPPVQTWDLEAYSFRWRRDGRSIVTMSEFGQLHSLNIESAEIVPLNRSLTLPDGPTSSSSLDLDSERLVYLNQHHLRIVALDSLQELKIIETPKDSIQIKRKCVHWNPAGPQIATNDTDGTIRFWDANTGMPGPVVPPLKDRYFTAISSRERAPVERPKLAFSKDGGRLAWNVDPEVVQICDTTSGDVIQTIESEKTFWSLALNQDGSQIACVEGRSIRIRNTADGSIIRTVRGSGSLVRSLDWHPSPGGLIAASVGSGRVQLFQPDSGEAVFERRLDDEYVRQVTWSPDGTRLAIAGSHTFMILDASSSYRKNAKEVPPD